jgi:type IV secretory pathway TraG/TraD family ATPase VirD4
MDRITHFARTNARNDRRVFGIKRSDRLSHMYVIGKTGTGKSTLLERLILSDIEAGEGLVLVDPHGDLVERIVARVPEHRKSDVIFLDVPRPGQPYGYNPLKRVAPEKRPLAASGLLEVFEKMWPEAWGVRWSISFGTRSSRSSISRKRRFLTFSGCFQIRHFEGDHPAHTKSAGA